MNLELWLVPVLCLLTLLVLRSKQSEAAPLPVESDDPIVSRERTPRT